MSTGFIYRQQLRWCSGRRHLLPGLRRKEPDYVISRFYFLKKKDTIMRILIVQLCQITEQVSMIRIQFFDLN
jgi:hypothetical protein